MKKLAAAVMSAVVLAGAATAVAQSNVQIPRGVFYSAQLDNEYLAKDRLIGAKVRNKSGEIVGDIEDLIISDRDTNRIIGVIMGVGGFFGAGEKKVGIRLNALQFDDSNGKLVVKLDVTKDVLKAVPAYERAKPKKSLLERAKEKAQELTDKTTDSAKDAYDKAKKEAGPAYEKAKEAVKGAIEKGKDAVDSMTDSAKKTN